MLTKQTAVYEHYMYGGVLICVYCFRGIREYKYLRGAYCQLLTEPSTRLVVVFIL